MSDSNTRNVVLSVIIPIFNVDRYLKACLESIVAQTTRFSFEVILVDDCSPDNSAKICETYVTSYPDKFRYIKLDRNCGVAAARNRGLEHITGTYFTFVDPDDLLPSTAFAVLINTIKDNRYDVVKGNNTRFNDHTENPANFNSETARTLKGQQILTEYYKHRLLRGHCWGKIYRSEKLAHIRFQQGISMAEDLLYNAQVMANSQKVRLISDKVYRYRLRENGAAGKKFENGSYQQWLDCVDSVGHYAETHKQKSAYKQLQTRTLLEFIREVRKLPEKSRAEPLRQVSDIQKKWDLGYYSLAFKHRTDIQTLLRFHKYLKTFNAIKNIHS